MWCPKKCRLASGRCLWRTGVLWVRRLRCFFPGVDPSRIEGNRAGVQIRIANTGFFSKVSPIGRLDATTCAELQDALDELIDGGTTRIVLDLQETAYISSAGLRVILNAAKRLHGSGKIVISGVVPKVRNILNVAGIPEVIDVYTDPAGAHAAFTPE